MTLKRFLLAWAVGMVIGAVLLGGLTALAGGFGTGDGLTAASPDLTADGMATVLLDESRVEGFTGRWWGEPPLEDGWTGRSASCDEALAQTDVPDRGDDMRQVALFDRENDGAELRHELTRVPAEGATLDGTREAYEACAGPEETAGPHGAVWTVEMDVEEMDGLGEAALLVRSRYTTDDGDGVWEWVEIISARGGVVSSLRLSAGIDRSAGSVAFGEIDESWVTEVATEIDGRIVAALE